jgi:alkanesulfonate monooxygenase SsuD/methylene tetrahydromethanopterin reductase-like flavin-dependent oxidoreductase (luciferase family)
MKVGITLYNIGPKATRENILQMAIQVEKEGFDSLLTIRRILWPLKSQSTYLASPDGSLPIEYQNVLDALDVLAYVAANTNNIALGTHVEDMFFFRTPITLAKRPCRLRC